MVGDEFNGCAVVPTFSDPERSCEQEALYARARATIAAEVV
jgi:hypothetical protein